MSSVFFLPDGGRILSGGADTAIHVWDITGRLSGRINPAKPTPRQLDDLWELLAGEGGPLVYNAICTLAAAPEASVPYLRGRFKVLMTVDTGTINDLIKKLDHQKFPVREQAMAELSYLARLPEKALRRTLMEKPSPEAERRIRELLRKIETLPQTPRQELLRHQRAVEALVRIEGESARQLLRDLAARAASPEVKEQAQAALARP